MTHEAWSLDQFEYHNMRTTCCVLHKNISFLLKISKADLCIIGLCEQKRKTQTKISEYGWDQQQLNAIFFYSIAIPVTTIKCTSPIEQNKLVNKYFREFISMILQYSWWLVREMRG